MWLLVAYRSKILKKIAASASRRISHQHQNRDVLWFCGAEKLSLNHTMVSLQCFLTCVISAMCWLCSCVVGVEGFCRLLSLVLIYSCGSFISAVITTVLVHSRLLGRSHPDQPEDGERDHMLLMVWIVSTSARDETSNQQNRIQMSFTISLLFKTFHDIYFIRRTHIYKTTLM